MEVSYLKGAMPVPGPTMMIGVCGSFGSRKSGFLAIYTGRDSPGCTAPKTNFQIPRNNYSMCKKEYKIGTRHKQRSPWCTSSSTACVFSSSQLAMLRADRPDLKPVCQEC